MDIFYRVIALLGGLALFLYGMRIMGDGLKSSSGGVMKQALAKVTDKPVKGFILGMLVTCMIQSSTATIVLTVGLVGAGFLTFRQSTGIVLGANVGTAITAQIIRLMDVEAGSGSILYFFKSDNLAPFALVVGIILIMFISKKSSSANAAGTICMGFGILFVGLMNMSSAVSTMSESLSALLVSFENNYFLGFLSGVVVTGVIQSSSAVVGILQSIASSVGVTFCGVFAVILGVNIGDCLTTYLVCRIGAKPDQTRTVLVHVIYNICASILVITVIAIARGTGLLNDDFWFKTLHSGGVANIHGIFRLVPAVALLPFANAMASLAERIVKDEPVDEEDAEIEKNLRELDMHLIDNPRLALDESAALIGRMGDVASHNFLACTQQMFEFEEKREGRIRDREDLLDRMADAANQYIVAVSPHITLDIDNRTTSYQYKALVCFERIGDLALNVTKNLATLRESGNQFSDMALQEMRVVTGAISDVLELATDAYQRDDVMLAQRVEPLEEVIDELIENTRERHMYRMTHGLCEVTSGIEFQNILLHLERISDQCSDLAVYLLGRRDDNINGREHQYIHMLHKSDDAEYKKRYKANYDKYFSLMDAISKDTPREENAKK